MDTNMVLLALEDLPISNAVAEFGFELQFLKSLPGTLCCSWKHAEKNPSECLCYKIRSCIYKQQSLWPGWKPKCLLGCHEMKGMKICTCHHHFSHCLGWGSFVIPVTKSGSCCGVVGEAKELASSSTKHIHNSVSLSSSAPSAVPPPEPALKNIKAEDSWQKNSFLPDYWDQWSENVAQSHCGCPSSCWVPLQEFLLLMSEMISI